MSELDFAPLGARMIQAGVAPHRVTRMLAELYEHGAHLEADARQRGLDSVAARAAAREALGSDEAILARAAATPSLRSWGARWPIVTMLLVPIVGCCISGAMSLVLAALFYHVGTSAHLAAADGLSPGSLWYALTTGLTRLAVYVLPLLSALFVMRYAVSRRLATRGVVFVSVLVLAIVGAMTTLEFTWPDAIRHQPSIRAGLGFSTDPAWLSNFAVHCLVVVGPALAYRQWLVRRAAYGLSHSCP